MLLLISEPDTLKIKTVMDHNQTEKWANDLK